MARKKKPSRRGRRPPSERRSKMTVRAATEEIAAGLLVAGVDAAHLAAFMKTGILCDEAGLAVYAKRYPELCPLWRETVERFRQEYPERVQSNYRPLAHVFEELKAAGDGGSEEAIRLLAMAMTLSTAGITVRELVNLRTEDVDLESVQIRVRDPGLD